MTDLSLLNHFIPVSCNNNNECYMHFLTFNHSILFQLLDYSKGHKGPYGNDPRYVRVGCPNNQGKTEFIVQFHHGLSDTTVFVFSVGVMCTLIFTLLVILATSKQKLATFSELTENYSYEGYGLYWGLSATATVFVIFVAYIDFQTVYMAIHDIPSFFWPFQFALLVFWILSSLMTAMHVPGIQVQTCYHPPPGLDTVYDPVLRWEEICQMCYIYSQPVD